jgi:hypothetical protein
MENLKQILSKYKPEDAQAFKDTTDMLCTKGIGNGCYQDYAMLMDVVRILALCEAIIEKGDLADGN